MKHSNGDLQSNVWGESRKNAKEKQNLIETLRWYDEQIVKPQNWNFTRINTIKNFITFKNNSYRVVESLIKRDGEKGWEVTMFDENTLDISNNVENSTCIIPDDLSWHCIGTSESGNFSDFNDSVSGLNIYDNYLFKFELDINEHILKKGTFSKYLTFYAEGI